MSETSISSQTIHCVSKSKDKSEVLSNVDLIANSDLFQLQEKLADSLFSAIRELRTHPPSVSEPRHALLKGGNRKSHISCPHEKIWI
jgi:hypothetical protein